MGGKGLSRTGAIRFSSLRGIDPDAQHFSIEFETLRRGCDPEAISCRLVVAALPWIKMVKG